MKKQFLSSLLCGLLFAPCALFAASYDPGDSPYITINGMPVMNGERLDTPFCQEEPGQPIQISFELKSPNPTIDITSIEWDFGDGITREYAPTEVVTYKYAVENWYDVKAILKGGFVYGDDDLLTITASFAIRYCPPVIPQCLELRIFPSRATYECGKSYFLPYMIDEEAQAGDAYVVFENGTRRAVTMEEDNFIIDLSDLRPGTYNAHLEVEDINCGAIATTRTFAVNVSYPATVFTLKFNNVLAVYQYGQGGNHYGEFKAFQWYKNGLAIEGATQSIYHSETVFKSGDEYSVLLTDENGNTSASCPLLIPEGLPIYTPSNEDAPAVKALVNQRMVIQLGEKTYDMYGQRVQ